MIEEQKNQYSEKRRKSKELTTDDRIKHLEKLYKKLPQYITLLNKIKKIESKLDKKLPKSIYTEVTSDGSLVKNSDDLKLKKIEKMNLELEIVIEKLWKLSEKFWDIHMSLSDEHDFINARSMMIQEVINDIYDNKTSDIFTDDDFDDE